MQVSALELSLELEQPGLLSLVKAKPRQVSHIGQSLRIWILAQGMEREANKLFYHRFWTNSSHT